MLDQRFDLVYDRFVILIFQYLLLKLRNCHQLGVPEDGFQRQDGTHLINFCLQKISEDLPEMLNQVISSLLRMLQGDDRVQSVREQCMGKVPDLKSWSTWLSRKSINE